MCSKCTYSVTYKLIVARHFLVDPFESCITILVCFEVVDLTTVKAYFRNNYRK